MVCTASKRGEQAMEFFSKRITLSSSTKADYWYKIQTINEKAT